MKITNDDVATVEMLCNLLINQHGYDYDFVALQRAGDLAVRMKNELKKSCECRPEWMSHVEIFNSYPYGWDVEYDECKKCGKQHNFTTK